MPINEFRDDMEDQELRHAMESEGWEEEPPEAVEKASRDLLKSITLAGRREARYVVDTYYQIQRFRIRVSNQISKTQEYREPNQFLQWTLQQFELVEGQLKTALGRFAKQYEVGRWLQSICGIGPVISAGLLAHLDIRRAPTCANFWSFAGLNPSRVWEPGQVRPWNAQLRTLVAFKAGGSFIKVANRDKDFYGKYFLARRRLEWERNLAGHYREQAEATAERVGKTTATYKWVTGQVDLDYAREIAGGGTGLPTPRLGQSHPMLSPGHILARARRYAAKLFLSHVHDVMHRDFHGQPGPKPYCFNIPDSPHQHFIEPPNWPLPVPARGGRGAPLSELFAIPDTAPVPTAGAPLPAAKPAELVLPDLGDDAEDLVPPVRRRPGRPRKAAE